MRMDGLRRIQDPYIVFVPSADILVPSAYCTWEGTEQAIEKREPRIRTTQMGMLSTDLFEKGYRIFVSCEPNEVYEIVLGTTNERTRRDIRMGHNLFKMWRQGEFDD